MLTQSQELLESRHMETSVKNGRRPLASVNEKVVNVQ